MRGVIQNPELTQKTLGKQWAFFYRTDPAEAHDCLIEYCLQDIPNVISSSPRLADFDTVFSHVARIFPSQRTVLELDRVNGTTTVESDNLQQLINRSHHTIASGTPELQVLELGRRGYDIKRRAWFKDCRKVTIPDKVTINSTSYVLYAIITHTGDFRSQRYNPYIRPGGMGQAWYSYHRHRTYPVTPEVAVTRVQGSGEIMFQRGVTDTQSNEVAHILYYGREDVMTDEMYKVEDNAKVNVPPRSLPGWIADLESHYASNAGEAIAAATAATRAQAHHADDEDHDEGDDDGNNEEVMEEDDDGDEVMEEVGEQEWQRAADDHDSDRRSTTADDGSGSTDPDTTYQTVSNTPPRTITNTVRTYIARDYYEGPTLRMQPHGMGKLIAISTGDQYVGNFKEGYKCGHGTLLFANGDIYDGLWDHDEQNGQGKLVEAGTGNVYTGGWKDGRPHGRGTTEWQMAQDQRRGCRICFSAEAQIVFLHCGHVCACEACASRLDKCPVCRQAIAKNVKIYWAE